MTRCVLSFAIMEFLLVDNYSIAGITPVWVKNVSMSLAIHISSILPFSKRQISIAKIETLTGGITINMQFSTTLHESFT